MYLEEIGYKSSRIKVLTDKKKYFKVAFEELVKQRSLIESYISKNKFFEVSLKPISVGRNVASIIKVMVESARVANVGPMASVAGTLAEFVVRRMIQEGAKVAIVENGGDIFAITDRLVRIGVFSGNNIFSGKFAFELDKHNTPLAICSSSSFLGHSLSFGECDLAIVFSNSGGIADAVATALANRIIREEDIKEGLEWAVGLKDVNGAMIIKGSKVGMIGVIPALVKAEDKDIGKKVTKDIYWFDF